MRLTQTCFPTLHFITRNVTRLKAKDKWVFTDCKWILKMLYFKSIVAMHCIVATSYTFCQSPNISGSNWMCGCKYKYFACNLYFVLRSDNTNHISVHLMVTPCQEVWQHTLMSWVTDTSLKNVHTFPLLINIHIQNMHILAREQMLKAITRHSLIFSIVQHGRTSCVSFRFIHYSPFSFTNKLPPLRISELFNVCRRAIKLSSPHVWCLLWEKHVFFWASDAKYMKHKT